MAGEKYDTHCIYSAFISNFPLLFRKEFNIYFQLFAKSYRY